MSSITGDAAFDAWIYQAARDEIRKRGGLLTTEEAVKHVLTSPEMHEQMLKYASTRYGDLGKEFAARWRASPEKTMKWLEAELAELESPY